MYQPPHFREDRLAVQHGLIRAHPFGLLVTAGRAGLAANPLPFVLDAGASPLGTLKAHLARANDQWRDLDPTCEALAIFQGPEAYVTPSWYATKRETALHTIGTRRSRSEPSLNGLRRNTFSAQLPSGPASAGLFSCPSFSSGRRPWRARHVHQPAHHRKVAHQREQLHHGRLAPLLECFRVGLVAQAVLVD